MTGKRRKRYLTDEDVIDLGADDGSWVRPGDCAKPPDITPPAAEPMGRPPGSTEINYEDVDPFIEYHLDHPAHLRGKTLFDVIRIGYALHNSGDPKTPGDTTIKDRIALLKSRRK
jgi:hypothetical protein